MKLNCSIAECDKVAVKRGWCGMHYMRWRRFGRLENVRRPSGSGSIHRSGHVSLLVNGKRVYEHIVIAARALGHQLPAGAQVHHVDLNPRNNTSTNLGICPTDAYHKLLHRRLRALNESGNPNLRKCHVCKGWDDPRNLRSAERSPHHVECVRHRDRLRYKEQRQSA